VDAPLYDPGRALKEYSLKHVKPLRDGTYVARCKEETYLSAAMNGHANVFPEAKLEVKDGWAYFYKGGKQVWSCNPLYAATYFKVQPA